MIPKIGENFRVFSDIESAKEQLRIEKKAPVLNLTREAEVSSGRRILNLILKADVLGSIEAIEEILKGLPQEKLILRILKSEAGEITESDVKLAKSAQDLRGIIQSRRGQAVILGFRVKISPVARQLAEREKIRIMSFEIIYDLVEEIRKFMERITETEVVREELGKLKALVVFLTEKSRQIVGGKVIEGEVRKGAQAEVFRGEMLLGQGKLINLQRNKKDIEQIGKGEECGILYEGDVRIEEGDILVAYTEGRRRGEP